MAIIRLHSEHLPGVTHEVIVLRSALSGLEIEEAVPVGSKKDGWRGFWHAITSPWTVKYRRLD